MVRGLFLQYQINRWSPEVYSQILFEVIKQLFSPFGTFSYKFVSVIFIYYTHKIGIAWIIYGTFAISAFTLDKNTLLSA